MSNPFDFSSVGLGISFDAPQHQQYHKVPTARSMPGLKMEYNDYSNSQQYYVPAEQVQHRPSRPNPQIRTKDLLFENHRSRSALIPQRPTFEHGTQVGDHYQAPRSAVPVQRPFPSPTQRPGVSYTHSTPSTPNDRHYGQDAFQFSRTEGQDPRQDILYERRQQRRTPVDVHPPPQYYNSPRYMASPAGEAYGRNDSPSTNNSSYFYMTPSLQSTPFSDAGPFPAPESYVHHGSFPGSQAISSPVFEYHEERHGRFDDDDEMPEEAYVPTVMTNFPPLRPSALRRGTTDASRQTHDTEGTTSIYTSPASTPPSTPHQKERKVTYSRWTSAEDLLLKNAIAKNGDGKWSLVSQMVPGRTPMQCSTRWQGALNTSIHKGRWDPEEDAILIRSVAEWQAWHLADNKEIQSDEALQEELYKNIPWSNIAQQLPRPRTGVQALARWSEALDPRITKGKWTAEEDAALLRGVSKYGKCWIKIANGVNGRTQRQCRTRYCQISDKKRKIRGGPIHGSPVAELNFSD